MSEPVKRQCQAVVYKRDTYRYTGRGRSGFELHYRRDRCARLAAIGDWCRQHAAMDARGRWLAKWEHRTPVRRRARVRL